MSTTAPRVVVLSLAYQPTSRVQAYVQQLIEAGVDVDLVVAESSSTEEIELDPRARVHPVLHSEVADVPIRRIERILVYSLWSKAFSKVRSYTGRPALRKVDAALALTRRGQQAVSRFIHRRMFWPVFRVMRPLVLARRARGPVEALDLAGAERVVAADIPATPLAWRLARRYPDLTVTTALDLNPYVRDDQPA